jgi:hypothetical protein
LENKTIIIKIENNRVLFNPGFFIDITQTNIPHEYLTFRTNTPIYWKVEMINFIALSGLLRVTVLDYKKIDIESFNEQGNKAKVEKLEFVGQFDWQKLEPLLTAYRMGKFVDQLFNLKPLPTEIEEVAPWIKARYEKQHLSLPTIRTSQPTSISVKQPIHRTINENFWVDFEHSHFLYGRIAFKKQFVCLSKEIDLHITNDCILAEFENIKHWFIKRLKTTRFLVHVIIHLSDDEITDMSVTSVQIDLITAELIDSIKYTRTNALIKEPRLNATDKGLFTAEDIFSTLDTDRNEANVFNQSERDIMNMLIESNNIRNKEQLVYLSSELQSELFPIHYTLDPHFGFLFFVEGQVNNHFIWELLNSHATYVWTFGRLEQETKLQYQRIEQIINLIKTNGRASYKRAYSNSNLDSDLLFQTIYHKVSSTSSVTEFEQWRTILSKSLTWFMNAI